MGEARAYPSETSFRCSSIGLAPSHSCKDYTGLKRFAKDKHSNLLRTFVNYSYKMLYDIGSWPYVIKLFMAVIY